MQQPTSVAEFLADLEAQGAEGARREPDGDDEVQQRLQQLIGGRDEEGAQPDGQEARGGEPGSDDYLKPFREALGASDGQSQTDEDFEREVSEGFGGRGLVPREKAERLQRQRNALREKYAVGEDGKTGAYDEALQLLKQAGPDSRTAIANLTNFLYQQFQQQQGSDSGGYGMGQQQGMPVPGAAGPVYAAPVPGVGQGAGQVPEWAQRLLERVEMLAQGHERASREQGQQALLSSVESELRKWDLLDDPLAQQFVGYRMREDPSVPIPALVKQYADEKKRQFEKAFGGQPSRGGIPPPGSLSPDIGRGNSGAAPPAKAGGLDLRKLEGEDRIAVATRLIEGFAKGGR